VLAICVLIVACANVAGLLLSRSTVRAREIAVRLAMGATRISLVRQLLIENLLLAIGGGGAGLVVAFGAVKFFNTIPIPTDIPVDLSVRLDERVLLFTLVIAIMSTFLFGLTPALRGTGLDLMQALKEREGTASRKGRMWGRNLIVAGQVALSLVVLIISGVLLDGFRAQLNHGPGFRIDRLQLMSFDPGLVHYTDSQRELFYKQLLDKTRRAPDVKSATLTSSIPMSMGALNSIGVVPEGHQLKRGERAVDTFDSVVTPDYFDTMRIPVLQGRGFWESDKANTPPVAVVNEEFARHYWPNQSAVGKRLRLKDVAGTLVEIVGVAKTAKYLWISETPTDFVYLPFSQNGQAEMALIAQSKTSDAATLVPVLRQIVQSLDRNMPVFEVRTMKSLYESRAVVTPRMITKTVAAMGLMGLLLSVIGLYGVVSYSVSKRSREFGIRMAVGADRQKIVRMVLRQGLALGITGLTGGLLIGVFASRAITSSMLFSFQIGVAPFVAVSFLLLFTTVLSAYAPARRASLTDPIRALREE
jgi:predicted permease